MLVLSSVNNLLIIWCCNFLQFGFMLIALIWEFDFSAFMVLIIAILNDGEQWLSFCINLKIRYFFVTVYLYLMVLCVAILIL